MQQSLSLHSDKDFFSPIEPTAAVWLERVSGEVFGCIAIEGMKFLKCGCATLLLYFWGKYPEWSDNRLFCHYKHRRRIFGSSNLLEGIESSTSCGKWKKIHCFSQLQSCSQSFFFCLIFYLLRELVYFRIRKFWYVFKYRWRNLCVCVHLLGFSLILRKSFPLSQKVKVQFRFSRIYSLSVNFIVGHITSKIAIWRKMCDALIDREKPINPIWFRRLRNILITFWRFLGVLIYLINSYGDIWLSTFYIKPN